MIWTREKKYHPWSFEKEAELEGVIEEVKDELFGANRIYLEVKKLIGEKGKTRNIPDGYLLDLTSPTRPVIYLVEVELSKHDPLRHIASSFSSSRSRSNRPRKR